jgi:hypothetical protein
MSTTKLTPQTHAELRPQFMTPVPETVTRQEARKLLDGAPNLTRTARLELLIASGIRPEIAQHQI